jgi:zinc transport system substrate-binding protein
MILIAIESLLAAPSRRAMGRGSVSPSRPLRLVLALAALPALLLACAAPTPRAVGPSPTANSRRQPLEVMATFLPITLLTRAVAGDCARVSTLVPPSLGPHDFQAKPGDLLALRRSRVLVKNGLGIETFLDTLIAAADPSNLKVIDTSRGIATLAVEAGATLPRRARRP